MASFGKILNAAVCFLAVTHVQAEETARPHFTSPDKKWEFRVADGQASLVAASGEMVVDFTEEIGHLAAETGRVLWAPDSRRFAFNTRKGGKYYGCELYELVGAAWKKLPALEENKTVGHVIDRSLRKQMPALGAKSGSLNSVMTQWRVIRWTGNDTFEAYVSDQRRVPSKKDEDDWEYLGCAFSFRGKCDNRGDWKASAVHELSDAELEKLDQADE